MEITVNEFAKSFGVEVSELTEKVVESINSKNFNLIEIRGEERDRLLLRIVDKIRLDQQVIAAPGRKDIWEKGWAENLNLYINSGGAYETLIPKFIRSGEVVRWFGNYYHTEDPNFELNYIEVLREFVFEYFFKEITHLYEFGAGTGFNLIHANSWNPNLNLFGTDFVESSVKLMNLVGEYRKIPLKAEIFNMMNPSSELLRLEGKAGVVTFGSFEQLGSQIKPMINYLVEQRPQICVHIEPMIEMYNTEVFPDYLANWFQSKRGYSAGLIGYLKELEELKEVEVIKLQRLNFGSLMMEGFNLVAWRPI